MSAVLDGLVAAPVTEAKSHVLRSQVLRWSLRLIDLVALAAAWIITADRTIGAGSDQLLAGSLAVACGIAAIWSQQLYRARVARMRTVEQARMLRVALVFGTAVAAVHLLQDGSSALPRGAAAAGTSLGLLLVGRMGYRAWVQAARRGGRFTLPVFLIGIDSQTADLNQLTEDHAELGYSVMGVLGSRAAAAEHGLENLWRGDLKDLEAELSVRPVTGAILSARAIPADEITDVIQVLQRHGCHVSVSSGLSGIDHRRLQPVHLGYEPLLHITPQGLSSFQVVAKRAVDLILSLVIAVLVAPVLLVSVLAIKLEDRGPVLFRQERVGRHGRRITMLKLRTMVVDAESRLTTLLDSNERSGPLFKMSDDPRVTRVGRVLRAASIDELPQLWNVLRGEMSLVGPRPALPSEVARFGDRLQSRVNVLPGVTGLWQVEARDTPSFRSYERLDLYYVQNWSLGLDATIIVSTVGNEVIRVSQRVLSALRPFAHRGAPRTSLVALLFAGAALVIAGCSSGDDDSAAVSGQRSDGAVELEDGTTSTTGTAADGSSAEEPSAGPEGADADPGDWPVPTTEWAPVAGPIVVPVELTEEAEFGTGVTAEVTAIESVTVEGGLPGERAGPGVAVTVALINGTDAAISLDHVIVDLVKGDGASATPIDSAGTVPLSGSLPADGSTTGTYHYFLPADARSGASVVISYATGVPSVVFTGDLPGA